MALDGAKFICLSDAAAADARETTPTATTGVEAGGIGDASTSENIVIKAKGRKFTVGYYMNCDYVLEDPRAIGVHCEIQCDAFGRVTIHNNSEAHPISVNEQIITLKRPLLDGSRIKILDRIFLWQFPKSSEATATSKSTQGDDVTNNVTVSTPQKLVAVSEQAPNSCPDLKHHRKVDKRFTVHNFAYCINSDEEGNTSSDLPIINESESVEEAGISELVTQKESNKKGSIEEMSVENKEILASSTASQDSADGKATLEISNVERRSITPEPQKNEPTITSTPLIKFEGTPKMNLINCTQNKENRSTEKTLRLLSFCKQSDVVITSFSPRETGVRIEKSFTLVVKPSTLCSTTPKSVYSTPKSMLSDYNDESIDFIDFTTPATSKKGARLLSRNSSMHLIDLTTPSKLAPDSSRHRVVHKRNQTLPSHAKLSSTPMIAAKKGDADLLPLAQTVGTPLNKSESSPQSAESIISVDETSDSSAGVIEISGDDSPVPSTSSPVPSTSSPVPSTSSPMPSTSSPVRTGFTTKTSQRPTQKPFTSTPLRTPQSLLKRAIVTSAKKQINSSLRSALGKATPTRQPTSTSAFNRKLDTTGTVESTPKSRISIGSPGSVVAAQRRNISPLTRRTLTATSHSKELTITPSTTTAARLTQNRKIPASASRLNTTKHISPLHGVRKSFGGTTLTSHISKTRRSVISPRKHSPTSVATKLAAKARKSFIPNSPNNRQVASRALSLVTAAVSAKNRKSNPTTTDTIPQEKDNVGMLENTTGKEIKNEAPLEGQNEVDDLSRTFTVDDSMEEVQIKSSIPSTASILDASTSQKQELNKTFSPEKSVTASESKVALDITVDIAETSIETQKEGNSANLNDKDNSNSIITEHISESFAEVVEAHAKTDEKTKIPLKDTVEDEQQNDTIDEISKMSGSCSESQKQADDVITTVDKSAIEVDNLQDSKFIEEQVIETLDAGEICGNVSVENEPGTPTTNYELTPSSSSETIDNEDMTKGSGESQGTAELLEEIDYVLNKSDELQQQLNKDALTSNIEVPVELEAAIEDKLGDKMEDVSTKNNFKTDVNINFDNAGATAEDEPATSSTSQSVVPTSSDIREAQEDVTSNDSNIITTASQITSTDLDANSIQTELLSITSIDTPSEFDVPTNECSLVEKSVVADERDSKDQKKESSNQENDKIVVDSETEVTEYLPSIKTVMSSGDKRETVADAESITDDMEGIVHTTVEDLETKNENVATSEEDSANKSKVEVIHSINSLDITRDSQTTLMLRGVSIDNNKEAETTESQTEPLSTEVKETESVPTELEQSISIESEPKDAEKATDEIKTQTSNSGKTITTEFEPDSIVEENPKPEVDDLSAANSDRNCDSEIENEILVAEKDKPTSTADETEKITASEPKTTNLFGTPKQKETTTPRFVGLRNLMRTPKACTSAAAAAGCVEADIDDNKFTPRRSARRRASANPELTPTPKIITETDDTPRRTTRRRASASAEVNYTPQRITRRRSSLALENDGAADKALTPIKRGGLRAKRPGTIAEVPVAEDMGAIIEEELKESVQESSEGQNDFVETEKKKEVIKTEAHVQGIHEVIEESICEEVNTEVKKHEVVEQKEEIVEDNINKVCDKIEKSTNDTAPTCVTEKLDEKVDKAENATESESQQTQITQVEQVVAGSPCNVTEVLKEECITEAKDFTTDKTAEILDESDYEYGKEVIDQTAATASTDSQPKTPKTQRKSVRIAETKIVESPKTPVMVGMRELLRTPKDCGDTPKLIGVRDLVRTPKTILASVTMDVVDDAESLTGLVDLMKTPKVAKTRCENIEATEEDEEPSTSTTAHADFTGMRELLKTPKHTSTPYYSGMREMLRTPKACSTPQLAGVGELMETPKRTKLDVEYDGKNEELDQFFKTPRAKNIMIPADPASAILEPSSDSSAGIMMAATTEYDLHSSSSQRPLEEIYKTPMITRFTNVEIEQSEKKTNDIEVINDKSISATPNEFEMSVPETPAATCNNPQKATTSKRNLSAEDAFDEMVGLRTTLDDTPPQKVYTRKQQAIVAASPFSATDVISDLPKTDIQEWVDKLEEESELVEEEEEQEFTASTSILDASKATHDPIAASMYGIGSASVNQDTTEELLADMSAVSSMVDPLQSSAGKTTKSLLTIDVDENETLRPVTPSNTEISGINLLDQTTESVFSEPLIVSDTESVQLEENENDEVVTEKTINTSTFDAKKSQDGEEFPIMIVDSSDSEQEEDVKTKSATKKAEIKSSIEMVKPMPEDEVIELDNESTADVTTKPDDIHEEFINFQANKNIAGQHMRASTPNRSVMQSTRERRQSVGGEQIITEVSIDVSLEKSRLTKEKLRTVIETVVEVDEESVNAATTKDNITVNTSANATEITTVIPNDEEPTATATTTESKETESEFNNFFASKAITSREKRAATPDQVNRSQAQKITQSRRLTLGAEQHLPNITIDFEEEKIKLEQLKQQPPCIEESPLERDDSFIAETLEEVETLENTAEVTISMSEPKEIENSAKDADDAEAVEDDVQTRIDREENESKVEENILENPGKEADKTSDGPEKDPVQDLEADISSAAKHDAQSIANVAECLAEKSQNVEDNKADVCGSPTVENITNVATTKGDNENKTESVDTVVTDSNLSRETTVSGDDTPTVALTNEEIKKAKDADESTESSVSELINAAKPEDAEDKFAEEPESIDVEEIILPVSTKEDKEKLAENTDAPAATIFTQDTTKAPEESKHEIINDIDDNTELPTTDNIPEVKSEEHNSGEAPGSKEVEEIETEALTNKATENNAEEDEDHQVPAASKSQEESSTVESEHKKKISSAEDEFDESDIFDLTEELPTETPTINTTQGVLFDLTEEDVESTVETNTGENATHVKQKPHDMIESTETTEDIKESVEISIKEDNAESTSAIAVEELLLTEEVPAEETEVSEKKLNATTEVEASPANTSTDNEAFTLAVSTESELENDEETPEVATETTKANVVAVNSDITNEVEESNSQLLDAEGTDVVEHHSDEKDVPEELTRVTTELNEANRLTKDRKAEMESETRTLTTSTADESETAVQTGIEDRVVPEDDISSSISPTAVETDIANKETKENEAIQTVCEVVNKNEQLPTKELAVATAVVTEEAKEEAETAAEIHEISVNQEKSEVIGDNDETEAQHPKQTEQIIEEAEIMPLKADSTVSHVVQQTAELKALKGGSHNEKVVIEKSVKSIEDEEQASELLNVNEIDGSVHQTPVEAHIEEQQIETPTFSGNQQPVERRGLKASKQNEEGPICKPTLESKPIIEEKVTVEAQTLIDTGEKEIFEQVSTTSTKETEVERITKAAESREDVSKMSVKVVSDLSENLETVETKHETSVKTQVPSKRRGRKPSRSKQTTEENEKLLFTTAAEKTTSEKEIELSGDIKAITEGFFEESPSSAAHTTADSAVATSTRHKTEPEFYKKVNYEVCISESAETAHDVKTDKSVEHEIPAQNEKSIIDAKYAEQSEVVDITTGQQLASSTEIHEETDATETLSKTAEAHEPRRARRIRKASQSSQCSVHDDDHLPTTTTRRRGGRRRADTPLEHIATDVTTSDAPTVKRRRQRQDKVVEDTPLEELHAVHIDESKIATVKEDAIEIGNTSEESKVQESGSGSIEDHSRDVNNDVQRADDQLEEATTSKKWHMDPENAGIKKGANKRRLVAKATAEIDDGVQKDSQHSDVDELSNVHVATKRGRRKQTHSESSEISVTMENTESHTTKRRQRGHNATSDKSTMEDTENNHLHKNEETAQSKEDDTVIMSVLPIAVEVVEIETSSEDEIAVKGDPDAIKTEPKTEKDGATATETSKRTRNKRTHKVIEISKSNKELPDETEDIKPEPQDEKAVMEEEEPLKKVTVASHTRVNRRKEADAEDEHHNKTEESEQVPKDEGTAEKEVQNKIDEVEQAVVETTNTNADSVCGRRGRRGAAAAATVAINEVSSAHKRGVLRGKSHQNKLQATRKEAETKKETDTQLQTRAATDHDAAPNVIEEKKPQKSGRRRRISLKEMQTVEEGEGVEKRETENDAGSTTKVAAKRSRKRPESNHADEQQQMFNKSEVHDETSTSAAPTKQRSRRKRKDSHHNINDVVVGDEPPKKRPLSRKRRDSSLDSSIHEGTGIDMDTNPGANTSSSSTTPQRPRRAAAAQDRNYDESSDAEAQVDLKRRIEKASLPKASTTAVTSSSSKQRSPTTAKTPKKEMVSAAMTEVTAKTTSTPILSTVVTTSRGRQRKPTARVQQYLEEERAKAETPKKRLLIGSAAVGDTPTSQAVGTPARRARKASTLETEVSEMVHTPVRSRARTAKPLPVAETSEESRSEMEHTHSEWETTHSSNVEEKAQTTKGKVTKRPTRGRGKHPVAVETVTTIENDMSVVPATTVATPTEAAHTGSGRVGRAAKAAAAAALITDDPIGSHTKARGGRTRRGADVTVNEEVQPSDTEVKEVRTEVSITPTTDVEQTNKKTRKAATSERTARGGRGRKKLQDHDEHIDEPTNQHTSLADGEANNSDALPPQPQHPIIVDADDEHEDDEETLTTEAADLEVAKSLAGAKLTGKKRTAATRKATAATAGTAESPAPKRGRRRAVLASVEEVDAASHLDTRAESATSSRSRKVVRFDAATPSSVASATMSVDTATEETEDATLTPAAPAKRATRSRRK